MSSRSQLDSRVVWLDIVSVMQTHICDSDLDLRLKFSSNTCPSSTIVINLKNLQG